MNRKIGQIEFNSETYNVEVDASIAYSPNPLDEKILLYVTNPTNNDRRVSLIVPKVLIEHVERTYDDEETTFLLGLARSAMDTYS
jgi:hypothetical protein